MGDTKRARERKGNGKREARQEFELERELTADPEPPTPETDGEPVMRRAEGDD